MKKLIINTLKYALRSYPLIRPYVKEIEQLYNMSQKELDEYNNLKFLKLVNLAYNKSPFYRNLYDEYGVNINTIKSIEDIRKLPTIDKKTVRENSDKIAIGNKKLLLKAPTSGTTGEPLTILQSYRSILIEQAFLYHYRASCGFKFGEPLVSLRGHLDRTHFKLKLPIGKILYLSSYQLKKKKAIDYYNEIKRFKPKTIEGYPSSLYNLCCLLKEANLSINIPICFTSSETLYDFQRELFKEVLNCETYDWYGCTEHTICLGEDINHNGYFEMPGYSFNEFFDNHIITTSFINPNFPLIRYKVNDIIVLKNDYKKIKATDPNIESIEGRTENSIVTKSGTIATRLQLFKNVSYIKLAQIIQREQGKIEINILPDGPFSDLEKGQIMKHIDERIGLSDIDVTINTVSDDKIIYSKRNKFNQVIRL